MDLVEPGGRAVRFTAPQGRRRTVALSGLGLALAVAVVLLLHVTGSLRASDDALVIMGFDPERARLITSLVAGAAAACAVAAVGGATAVAALASLGASGGVFWPVLRKETSSAMRASGVEGQFDPAGWLLTVLTLIVAGIVIGWAAATLTATVRRFVVAAATDLRRGPGSGINRRGILRATSAVAVVAILGVTFPVFADMVNYSPDAHMRTGAPAGGGPGTTGLGTTTGIGTPTSSPRPTGSGAASSEPGATVAPTGSGGPIGSAAPLPAGLVAGPLAGSLLTPGALSNAQPWASSPPSGSGQVTRITLPGPWVNGAARPAKVDLYTPPGYPAAGVRYPVLYEVPYGVEPWTKGADFISMLDTMITSGQIPPMIVAFATTSGGPYADSECANSFDGKEHYDTYMATELVTYIDSHYATIPTPAARALIGASQGGYCAAALWSHHPDVFGSAVSFSGYFQSGVLSPETQNAALPFGSNAAYEAQQSPINVVRTIPKALAASSFVVLSADLAHAFFGTQLSAFAAALASAGVPMAILPSPLGHSWQTQRAQLPAVLQLLAARMVQEGAFGKP